MVIVLHPRALLPSGGGVCIGDTFLVMDKYHVPCGRARRVWW
ncbi:MAG: hypothetical protein ABSC55_25765 [Syntrophorhabdales bacterium]